MSRKILDEKVVLSVEINASSNIFEISLSLTNYAKTCQTMTCTQDAEVIILSKYDIPVGFPPGITSPREDCRSRASSRGSYSWCKPHRDVISVLLYRTNTKHKNYKHQRFWINTHRLPC